MVDAWNDGFDGPRDGEFGLFHRVLTPDIVPRPGAQFWMEIAEFALSFDGYSAMGETLGEKANEAGGGWQQTEALPYSLVELRSFLFYEQRRWRHFDADPEGRDLEYLGALVEAIRAMAAQGRPQE